MKYELTSTTKEINGITLHRIRALKDFSNVKRGDLGGWIEKKSNLSQEGICWVYGEAVVSGNAKIFDNARVYGNAMVSGDAKVFGDAMVSGDAKVSGNDWVFGNVKVSGRRIS